MTKKNIDLLSYFYNEGVFFDNELEIIEETAPFFIKFLYEKIVKNKGSFKNLDKTLKEYIDSKNLRERLESFVSWSTIQDELGCHIDNINYAFLAHENLYTISRLNRLKNLNFTDTFSFYPYKIAIKLLELGVEDFLDFKEKSYWQDSFIYNHHIYCFAKDVRQLNKMRANLAKVYTPKTMPDSLKSEMLMIASMGECLGVEYNDLMKEFSKNDYTIFPRENDKNYAGLCIHSLEDYITILIDRAGVSKKVNELKKKIRFKTYSTDQIQKSSITFGFTPKEFEEMKPTQSVDYIDYFLAFYVKNKLKTDNLLRVINAFYIGKVLDCIQTEIRQNFYVFLCELTQLELSGKDCTIALDSYFKTNKPYNIRIFGSSVRTLKLLLLAAQKVDISRLKYSDACEEVNELPQYYFDFVLFSSEVSNVFDIYSFNFDESCAMPNQAKLLKDSFKNKKTS